MCIRDSYRNDWRRLRAENAPLRLVDGDKLVSAPITHFDDLVLSFVDADWKKGARIVGYSMMELSDREPVDVYKRQAPLAKGETRWMATAGEGKPAPKSAATPEQKPGKSGKA